MNETSVSLRSSIVQGLRQGLDHKCLDVRALIPLPAQGSPGGVRAGLEEVLEEFFRDAVMPPVRSFYYLLEVSPTVSETGVKVLPPSDETELTAEPTGDSSPPPPPEIYLPDGSLNITYLFRNAEVLIEAKEFSLARNIYRTILQAPSGEARGKSLYWMARSFELEGRIEDAQAHYEQALLFAPRVEAYQRLALILLLKKQYKTAAETLDRALHLKDLAPSLRLELLRAAATAWSEAQQPERAQSRLESAVELEPTAVDLHLRLGQMCFAQKLWPKAQQHYLRVLAQDHAHLEATYQAGRCAQELNQTQKAHDLFLRCLEEQPKHSEALYALVRCAYGLKTYAPAAQRVEAYLVHAPDDPSFLFCLAGLNYHLGRLNEAHRLALRIQEINPEHPGAQELLNRTRRYLGPADPGGSHPTRGNA